MDFISAKLARYLDRLRQRIHYSRGMKVIKRTPLHPLLEIAFRSYIRLLSFIIPDYRHTVSLGGLEAQFHVDTGDDMTHVVGLDGEKPVLKDFAETVEPGDVVYDIGSHLGIYGCLSAKKASKVYCFEPHPGNISALRANIELNNLGNVRVCECALSDSETTYMMPGQDTRANASISETGDVEVKVVKGAKLVENGSIEPPEVVKMDVEGHEYEALKGLGDVLQDSCRILYCEVHPQDLEDSGRTEEELYELIQKLGFETVNTIYERGPQKFIKAEK